MPTILRPEIVRAIESIYEQDYKGRIQICIGVDKSDDGREMYLDVIDRRPSNISFLVLQLPYSTSSRHGGIYNAGDGGCIRTTLSYMSNAQYVAYLDDDNMYLPEHVRTLREAIEGSTWASGQRVVVDGETLEHICVDRWDSVGPDRGRFKSQGGFIDPNCLMIDKLKVGAKLGLWSYSGDGENKTIADRMFFRSIAASTYSMVMRPTVLYVTGKNNILRRLQAEGAIID